MAFELPVSHEYMNNETGVNNQYTYHEKNTKVYKMYKQNLLEKVLGLFNFTLPDTWDSSYFIYHLLCGGFIIIFNDEKYGTIPQHGNLTGYNIFYRPKYALIHNPLLGTRKLEIDKDCTIIKTRPNYVGVLDVIEYYAGLLTLASQTVKVNMLNSHLTYLFGAESTAEAASYKQIYDDIISGNPSVVVNKKLIDKEKWLTFQNNISNNYIADSVLLDMDKIMAMFYAEVGIPDVHHQKKERLITSEVEAGNSGAMTKLCLWKKTIDEGVKKTNQMFGLNLDLSLNIQAEQQTSEEGE